MKRILHQIKSKIALNKHKLRKPLITVGVFIALAGGFLFYTINASAVSWWTGGNGAWGARKQLTVTNNSSASLSSGTSIAISIDTSSLVGTGKLRSDCADLRILYQPSSSTTTELTRHIIFPGNSTCATSTATKVYFKIQSSLASAASSTDYYLYYKNLSATAPIGTDDAFDVSSANATLVCPFNGTTTCAAGETPSTATGAIRYSGSKSAMSFSGITGAGATTSSATNITTVYQSTAGMTMELWVKVRTPVSAAAGQVIGTSSGAYSLYLYDGSLWFYGGNADSRSTTAYTQLLDGQWHHVAVTYNQYTDQKLWFWIDGVKVVTYSYQLAGAIGASSSQFYLGTGTSFRGEADEARVSNVERYTQNFTPSKAPFVRDANTVVLWHLDENGTDPRKSGKVVDDSGNGYDGTITSASYVAGVVGIDGSSSSATGFHHGQSLAGHEGIYIEEGTTNKITNPSFEHTTFNTNWTNGTGIVATQNTNKSYIRFGNSSAAVTSAQQYYDYDNYDSFHFLYSGSTNKRLSQGFQVTENISVKNIGVANQGGGSASNYMQVEIQTDSSGVPSGSVITNGTSACRTQSTSAGIESLFTFSTSPSVVTGTQYHWVIKSYTDSGCTTESSSPPSSNIIFRFDNTSSSYSYGSVSLMSTSDVWTADSTKDFLFSIYADTSTFTTSINAGNTNSHTLTAYVYQNTYNTRAKAVTSSIATLVFNGSAQTTTYTDMGEGWWLLSYTGAAGSGAQTYGVQVISGNSIYVDGIQLEEKTTALAGYSTTYTDGSLGTGYAWTGEANNSTSTRTAVDLQYASSSNISVSGGTFSAWVWFPAYYSSCSGAHQGILYTNGANPFFLGQNCGTAWFSVNGTNGGSASGTMPTYGTGKWHHWVGTWNGSTLAFYIDGVAQTPGSYTATPTATAIILNTHIGGGTGVDTEGLSDLRIFDTALTSTQVTDLYQAGLVGHSQAQQVDAFGDTKGESAYSTYHIDEAQGSTIYDSSLLANNMTLGTGSSAPTWAVDAGVSNSATKISSLKFDGSNDYAYRAYDADFDPSTSSFTVSGSFRHGNTISGTDTLFARYGSAGYKIYMNSSGYLCFGIDDDSTWGPDDSACSTVSYADSKWHTFSAVKTSTSSIAMYIDGVLAGSDSSLSATATLNTASSTSAYMGIDSDFASNPWIGNLDEFYFYSYARSAAQIKTDATGNGGAAVLGAQSNDPLMNGLMGYWKMDETTWNGTASEVVDSSGNGNHGTAVNGTITAPVKLGIGGSFDGVNDHITVGSSVPQVSNEMTVSSWVTPGDISSHKVILDRYSDRTDGYGLAIYTSQLDFYVMQDSVSKYWRSSAVFAAGQTYHIAVRYKNGEAFGYVNGQPITWSTTPTGVNSSIAAQSGVTYLGSQGGYGNYYYGKLDEFRIYNRALSPAEVQQLYNYAPGPVGHWKMDEKQGLSAFDSSGNGNTGVLTNGPVWANGKFGTGMKYDNVDDLVTISDSNSLDTPAGLTIEGWLNFSSVTASSDNGVFSKWQSGVNDGWFIESNYSGANWRIRIVHSDSTQTEVQVDPGTTSANRWYHIAITYDKSNLKVYRDGILVSTTAATKDLYVSNKPVYIGYSPASGGGAHFFPGTIDDVRMYNYGRSQAQVIQDMNAGHPLAGSPVGSQVAHWKLDEGQGTTANDSSINSNSLTLSSATSAWTNSGKFGKAWNGDGALYMSRADDADFDFTAVEDFAISGWVKSDSASNPGAAEYVVNKANATTAGYAVYFNTSGNLCFGIDDDTTWGPDIASCSTADVYDATWHHFSTMRDYSGTLKTFIYVDGISRDSDTDSTSATFANSLSLYVGDRDGTNNGDEFTGDIDEVKIYRGTLTPAEIKIDYNRGQSLVLGSVSNNSTYAPNAANQEYCVPGDSTSCVAPMLEWKFDENTGISANDSSGNGNTGTLTLGPSWGSGKLGGSVKLDGSDDYVGIGSSATSNVSNWSLSAWIKPSNLNQQGFAVYNGSDSGGYGFGISSAGGGSNGGSLIGLFGGVVWIPTGYTFTDTNWHHVEMTRDTSTTRFYVDGVQTTSTGSGTPNAVVAKFTVGSEPVGAGFWRYFAGNVDQARVFNYVRTPAQIAWDYNRGAPIAHWRLDECAGTVANDASGNGNTGTITIGASGTNTSAGNCTSGTSSEAWYNGVTGKFNSSLKFDGTDDYVSVADNSNLENAVMSLSAWIYTSAGFPAQTGIIGKRVTSSDFLQYELGISSNTLYWLQSADGGSWTTLVSTPSNTISAGWHHYVGTNNGTTARLYIDGKEVGTADSSPATTLASSTETLQIGQSRIGSNDNYFVGQIDDVRIYNYALTTTQIKNIMNGDFAVRYAPATGQP